MKHTTLRLFACSSALAFAFVLSAAAQNPTASVSAGNILTVTAIDGGFIDVQSAAAQPLQPAGIVEAITPNASGSCAWAATAAEGLPIVQIVHAAHVLTTSGTPALVHVGQNEYVVSFASTAAAPARVVIRRFTEVATTGTTLPSIDVDTDDDGVYDVSDLSVAGLERFVTLSPIQPVRVRIRFETTLTIPGDQVIGVSVALEPENGLSVDRLVTGCVSAPTIFQATPSFLDLGLDVTTQQLPNEVVVGVIGLAPIGLLLPNVIQAPCILLPAPDILVLDLHIPLPPAVRPLTFYVQGVAVTSSGLLASDGSRVVAF
ncbi:MAG: hypothetical protein JNK78_19280 [Planctomycetes bacterium]|nr:hypothetical protein [Planctomycetota bacterium]